MKGEQKSESRILYSIRKLGALNFEKVSDPLTLTEFILSLECRMSHHSAQRQHTQAYSQK